MTTQPPATLLSRFTAVDIVVSSFLHRHNPIPYSIFHLLELSGDFRLFFPLVLSLYFSPVQLPFPPSSYLRYLLLGLILDIAVIGLVKVVFRRSRPSYNHSSSMSVAVHADNFSFPSGHASCVPSCHSDPVVRVGNRRFLTEGCRHRGEADMWGMGEGSAGSLDLGVCHGGV